METILTWWHGLDATNQWFFGAAAFFSVFMAWQFIAALMGLGGHEGGLDSHVDAASAHHPATDAHDSVVAFKLLSFRSILAFCTLFCWANALYMSAKVTLGWSLVYSLLWGVAAMVLVSQLLYWLRKLSETGNIQMSTTVGQVGTVYLNIPAGGVGEVRMLCSGVMTHLKARSADGSALAAGKEVRVVKTIGPDTVEVAPDTAM
jgi:hypothetical protein